MKRVTVKRISRALVLAYVFMGILTVSYATGTTDPRPLEEIIRDANNVSTDVIVNTDETAGVSTVESGKDLIHQLGKAADMTESSEGVAETAGKMQGVITYVTHVTQLLMYFIALGLPLSVAIDLIYIKMPFTRGVLDGGNAPARTGALGNSGFGGGFGGGGFGGGMQASNILGGNRFSQFQNNNPGMMDNRGNTGRLQWVSDEARRAVAIAESGNGNPVKIYGESMTVAVILVPILLVLMMSGTLTRFGFMLGEVIARMIGNIKVG